MPDNNSLKLVFARNPNGTRDTVYILNRTAKWRVDNMEVASNNVALVLRNFFLVVSCVNMITRVVCLAVVRCQASTRLKRCFLSV